MSVCDAIAERMGELFTCTEHGKYVRVRTPFYYPDGDVVDVFAAKAAEGQGTHVLTDLGETMRWLGMQSLSSKRSPKQRRMIDDVCLTHGVQLFKGMLLVRVDPPEEIAKAVMRLGQAAVRVSDIWFTMRTRAVETVTDEVADYLTEANIRFERAERLVGRSGKSWTVDFHTWTPETTALTCVLATGSRASARGIVEHVVATWYDLNHLKIAAQPLRFVSLFDDSMDVWANEDFRLVEDLSEVGRWSRPDVYGQLLRAA